jgi:hypothetical protein
MVQECMVLGAVNLKMLTNGSRLPALTLLVILQP